MKSILILFAMTIAATCTAQNLMYSQTVWVNAALGTVTVPTGKVWKVERVVYSSTLPDAACNSGTTSCQGTRHDDTVVLDGSTVRVRSMSARAQGSSGGHATVMLWEMPMPIWLNEGRTLATGTGVLGISVIEFAETP